MSNPTFNDKIADFERLMRLYGVTIRERAPEAGNIVRFRLQRDAGPFHASIRATLVDDEDLNLWRVIATEVNKRLWKGINEARNKSGGVV